MIEAVGDETVVFDTDSRGAHCLKPVAAFVFGSCDGRQSVADIAAGAERHFGEPFTAEVIAEAVDQLESCGLLETPLRVLSDPVSRREAMRRFAFAGAATAAATPLITSIIAPAPAMALSLAPAGCSCTNNSQCTSGACCLPGASAGHCNASVTGRGCCVTQTNFSDCNAGTLYTCSPTATFCAWNQCHNATQASAIVCPSGSCNCCNFQTTCASGCGSNCPTCCKHCTGGTCTC